MNFVYDPKIAAQLALGAGYISSVKGVKEEAAKLNPDAAENTLVFPTDDMLSQLHQNDPDDVHQPRLREEVAGGPGQVEPTTAWARSSTATRAPRPTCCSRPGSCGSRSSS